MFNTTKPEASELPSTAQLLKSTGIAAAIAGALLVVAVLPAEYGIDPTGAGSILGLTEMGRIKMSLAEEVKAEAAVEVATPGAEPTLPQNVSRNESGSQSSEAELTAPVAASPLKPPAVAIAQSSAPASTEQQAAANPVEESVITLGPDEGREIKLVMKKGGKANFEWFTNGAGVNYDTHGDGPGIKYHGYAKGTNVDGLKGELVAAFDGRHGWFWRNRTDKDVLITLRTSGEYSELLMLE